MIFEKFPLVRYKQIRDNPKFLWYFLKRFFYYKYISHKYIPFYKGITFLSPQETLKYIIDNKASLARLGDGDIEQLTGAGEYPPDSDWSQKNSKELNNRIEEVLLSNRKDLLIAMVSPKIFLLNKQEAKDAGVLYFMWTDTRMLLYKYLRQGQVYGDANVFIEKHHQNFNWEKLYSFLKKKDVVIVTGITEKLRKASLGSRTFFVDTGKHNAFERYEKIVSNIQDTLNKNKLKKESTLVMVSLGPVAGILTLDFTKKGYQVWDVGHFFYYTNQKFLNIKNF